MNIAIIGCGLIGEKRARALGAMGGGHKLVMVSDRERGRAEKVARINKENAAIASSWLQPPLSSCNA